MHCVKDMFRAQNKIPLYCLLSELLIRISPDPNYFLRENCHKTFMTIVKYSLFYRLGFFSVNAFKVFKFFSFVFSQSRTWSEQVKSCLRIQIQMKLIQIRNYCIQYVCIWGKRHRFKYFTLIIKSIYDILTILYNFI